MKSRKVQWGWVLVLAVTGGFWWEAAGPIFAQSEQVVEVTIKDFKFVTKQGVLRLGFPTVIKVRNEDAERHDFGSAMFEGIPTQIEKDEMTFGKEHRRPIPAYLRTFAERRYPFATGASMQFYGWLFVLIGLGVGCVGMGVWG